MQINTYRTLKEARALLSDNQQRIVTNLDLSEVLARAGVVQAGAFDFCHSLAVGSQWPVIENMMSDELRHAAKADYDWYLNWTAHEDANGILLNDPDWFIEHGVHANRATIEGAWLGRSFQRFIDAKIHHDQFLNAGYDIVLRDGASELFDLVSHRVVISMGMEQIIQACLMHNNLTASIAAARMTFAPDGRCNGYHRNIIASSSKGAALDRFMALNGLPVTAHLVIGDSFIDIEMMPEGAFNVWILPHVQNNESMAKYRSTHFEDMLARVTIILYSNSLMPLVELIREAQASV